MSHYNMLRLSNKEKSYNFSEVQVYVAKNDGSFFCMEFFLSCILFADPERAEDAIKMSTDRIFRRWQTGRDGTEIHAEASKVERDFI